MDNPSEKLLEESVKRILEHADMNLLTESKVRKLAAEDTGLDLNIPANRKVVKRVIEDFFRQNAEEESEGTSGSDRDGKEIEEAKGKRIQHVVKEKRKAIIEEDSDYSEDKCSNKKQIVAMQVESDDGDDDASSQEEVPTRKQGKSNFRKNDDGDVVVCQLGPKRNLTVQEFKGNLLVSIREYYEKDGKQLPSAKGVSLSIEQWNALKEGIPDIQAAIKRIQRSC
ncbi:activated RNA polymerase II transcriptional coactivator p15 [Marchantia polymorpha subsp. ruderalis]|uniref:DEK-C domain-containing protein n=2 Tax=Marchantia polymorpha TaxID=3197 RepID=A0AAF6B1C3_MARPO|nr:hypothetical protein MARPO_0004s0058 [Marchantia polymorpha]BBN05807.1 hypothetical protein Mp_3g16130 [Marchantia polymorpha subsp. ruderalis]|eukprot:PTQ48770.1 hypothetical protein MARPO_0004s0058 [Marchantia polymorpha]